MPHPKSICPKAPDLPHLGLHLNRIIFDIGALYYDVVTARLIEWRSDCARLADELRAHDRLIIDLGTGPGVSAYEIAQSRRDVLILGVDISPLMLRRALRNRPRYPQAEGRVVFVRADAAALPLAARSVDVVTTHSTLYLVADREAVLREIQRVLKPSGLAVFVEPRRERRLVPAFRTWRRHPAYAWTMLLWGLVGRFEGAFREGQLAALAREAGLTVRRESAVLEGYGTVLVATGQNS
jgi:ubiquinone/menaquinone biosynthesis C-methylase UbiE